MKAAEMVAELRHRGADIVMVGDTLKLRAPRGAIDSEMRVGLMEAKTQIREMLAGEAMASYRQLRARAEDLGEQAEAARMAGDVAMAEQLEEEAVALIEGPAGDALGRVLALGDELIARVGGLMGPRDSGTSDASECTRDAENTASGVEMVSEAKRAVRGTAITIPSEDPPPFLPVPLSPVQNEPRPDRVCYNCGFVAWYLNPSGLWVCGVCHPEASNAS